MKLVFGRVPEEFMQDGEYYPGVSAQGNKAEFYYKLEIDEEGETITISDTCNRYMPMDMDSLDELTNILMDIKEYRNDRQRFIEHWQDRFGLSRG